MSYTRSCGLELRHRALESELAEAQQHPSIDDLKIVELKRRKLHLKDEIVRLRSEATSVHYRTPVEPPDLRPIVASNRRLVVSSRRFYFAIRRS